jgi:hypothetical protein
MDERRKFPRHDLAAPEVRQNLVNRYNEVSGPPNTSDRAIQRAFLAGTMRERELRLYAALCEYVVRVVNRHFLK